MLLCTLINYVDINMKSFRELDGGFGAEQKATGKEIRKKQNAIDALKVKKAAGRAEWKRKMLEHGFVSFSNLHGGCWYSRLPAEIARDNSEILDVYRKLAYAHTKAMTNLFDFYGTKEYKDFCKTLHEKCPRVADRLQVSAHAYSSQGRSLEDI